MKRICIVEDQQIAIDAIKLILRDSKQLEIIGTFNVAEEFIHVYGELNPDVSLVDLDLPGISGVEAITFIKSAYPGAKMLVLTNFNDEEKIFNALRAGADGYLLKKDALHNLESSILSLFDGGAPMTAEIARKVILHFQKQVGSHEFTTLTEKEKIVLQLLVDGLLYKEIADQMQVGIDAIKKHTQKIYEKLQVRTRSEAIRKFLTR
ncbi:MAG: response regulator transcription factor [Chitinophagaceae bacterium]